MLHSFAQRLRLTGKPWPLEILLILFIKFSRCFSEQSRRSTFLLIYQAFYLFFQARSKKIFNVLSDSMNAKIRERFLLHLYIVSTFLHFNMIFSMCKNLRKNSHFIDFLNCDLMNALIKRNGERDIYLTGKVWVLD